MLRWWLALAGGSAAALAAVACGRDGAGGSDAGVDATAPVVDAAVADAAVADAARDAPVARDGVAPDAPATDGAVPDAGLAPDASVLQFHNHLNRDGTFVDPALTRAAAATMHRDTSFAGVTPGHVYAQPLYVQDGPGARGAFFVVTEGNDVYALDEVTGEWLWHRNVGTPAALSGAGCGSISPIGITGTPAIDPGTRTMVFDSAVALQQDGPIATHLVHALSIDDGVERPGWPLDVSSLKSQDGLAFQADMQNQRSAVLLVGGIAYVSYGGHVGDCGTYHGWLVGVPLNDPAGARAYATPAQGAGMWAPGGPSSDGASVYVSTGNATTPVTTWQGNEAVLRFGPGPTFSGQPADYWAPADWATLDKLDADMSGTSPLVIDAPGFTPSRLLLALGKDGYAHLLSRDDLGGLAGKPLVDVGVDSSAIIGAPAWFGVPSGTYFVMRGYYGGIPLCPTGMQGDLATIKLDPTSSTGLTPVWCAKNQGEGSPIVTTTDGVHEPIVWTAGAEDSGRLHAWDAETGAPLFAGGGIGDSIVGLRHFTTLIAVHGRIFAGADDRLHAFTP